MLIASIQQFSTTIDDNFYIKLYQSIKTILGGERNEWTCQQILRFLSLLKVESKLQGYFYEFKITGQLLFDLKYIWQQLSHYLDSKTYFPIMKLLYVIKKINIIQNRHNANLNIRFKGKPAKTNKQAGQNQQGSKQQNQNSNRRKYNEPIDNQEGYQNIQDTQFQYLAVSGEILQGLQNQFKKMREVMIVDLSANQLVKIFKTIQLQRAVYISQIIKKYSIDGYSFVCLIANKQTHLDQIKQYFSQQEIQIFDQILNLLLPFYYKQLSEIKQIKQNAYQNRDLKLLQSNHIRQSFQSQNLKQSFGKSQYGTSQIYGESQAGSQQMKSQFGTSQYQSGTTQLRKSSHRGSQLARSQYGNSVYGNSQIGQSEYASSQYGNTFNQQSRQSLAQSVMGQSLVHQQIKKERRKQVGTSSIQDVGIILKLKQVALNLPFNLFKMDPLQNIKITTLNYPFTLNFPKPKSHQQFVKSLNQNIQKLRTTSSNQTIFSKQFNITGVKFGRSQQNDFRYPDQLSISGKHAQIGFWDNKYQIVDLQSKTGTFLYIPFTRPLILKDQQIIQLSNQIQIVVHILKKDPNQGVIKLEFTKPENEPFYKAALKQNQTLRIGRSEKSHIKLSQPSISSKHTQIKYQNQQFKIYDCLSEAGTWLRLSKKGVKSQMFPLVQGDIIRISSKKTYFIQKMTNCLQEDDQLDQYEQLLQNPNFKIFRERKSEDYFNGIIETAWKRKNLLQAKKQQNSLKQI